MSDRYLQKDGESQIEYIIRLSIILIDESPNDLNWSTICDLANLDCHYDSLRKAMQPKEFGVVAVYKYLKDKLKNEVVTDNSILKQIELQKQELYKEKIKFFDQRRELNDRLRKQAREEYLYDIIKESIQNSNLKPFDSICPIAYSDTDEMIIPLSDLHYGLTINNEFEVYNKEIFIERLSNYFDQVLNIKKTHKIDKCHIALLGDAISGSIHNTIRIANNEDVVSQIQNVSEYIAEFIGKLANEFSSVDIYYVSGNHSRNYQDKKESINAERLENFIPWYLKVRLNNFQNITIHESLIDNTIAKAKIKDKLCVFTHGDNDSPYSIAEKMTMMFGEKPLLCMFGHSHHFSADTKQKVKLIMSGSFCVDDEYCLNKRIIGEPSQSVVLIDGDGVKCIYDCKLN